MDKINEFYQKISLVTNIDIKYITLFLNTLLCYLILLIIRSIIKGFIKHFVKNGRKKFTYIQNCKIFFNLFYIVLLLLIWENYIKNLITLISFLSAAFAIALRDIILNFFCGIHIKLKKLFKVEDRIEVDGVIGDVINISSMEFSVLEIDSKHEHGQSTGIVVSFPNSTIFSKPIKNYSKLFKYVWNEIIVKVPLTSDVTNIKKELYKIVNNNEVIKTIPKKLNNQINNTNDNYRVYYNKVEPIIYTQVTDEYIELTIRYLMHPKKARYVNSLIWNEIISAYQGKRIDLYIKD